jgi:hypothetical protein
MKFERIGFLAVRFFRAVVASALFMVLMGGAWSGPLPKPAESTKPVIAVGDIHGDFDDLLLILQRMGIIDSQQHWIGSNSIFVQVGDLLDRGPKEREVMDLLMSLEKQAPNTGGQVVVLLGNHEVMNIMGDLRYVTPGNYASFADPESEKLRHDAYKKYLKWYKDHTQLLSKLPEGFFPAPSEADWMTHHPAGFIEQREAFSPKGRYGKWLREHAVVAKIGDSVFLHGGIHPRLAAMKLDAINARVRDEIRSFDSAKQDLIDQGLLLPFFTLDEITAITRGQLIIEMNSRQDERRIKALQSLMELGGLLCVNSDGPLWFRGYAQWSDEEGGPLVDKLLVAYQTAHLVVGHTPQRSGSITSRFGGKVLLIDTGMLRSYYPFGRVSALEIQDGGKFVAHYTDHQEVLIDTNTTHHSYMQNPAEGNKSILHECKHIANNGRSNENVDSALLN